MIDMAFCVFTPPRPPLQSSIFLQLSPRDYTEGVYPGCSTWLRAAAEITCQPTLGIDFYILG